MKVVTSRDNALFKSLNRLAGSSRERRKQGKTLLDGSHLIQVYGERIGAPELLAVAASAQAHREARAILAQFPGVAVAVLSDALFHELAPVDTPTGMLALISTPSLPLAGEIEFALLVEAVQDPGNLGSILRSAAAAGVDAAFLSLGCADVWSPKVLRGGMGAHFHMPLREGTDLVALANDFAGEVLATSLQGESSLFGLDLTGPVAVVVGNEGAGVTSTLQQAATRLVRIPMPGGLESLNAAAAAAVCLFERVRQVGN